ncbi:MAG: hypothetical protein AAGC44_03555 [Planctomycetota bacterium]
MNQAGPPPAMMHAAPEVPQSNGLGVAGFVVSMIGLILTGGYLCPIGVILSGIALFKAPRGFAIAGLMVGLLGSGVAILLFVLMVGWIASLVPGGYSPEQMAAEGQISSHAMATGALPDERVGNDLLKYYPDEWGTSFRYRPGLTPDGYTLTSAGPDRAFDTADDEVFSHTVYLGGPSGLAASQSYDLAKDPGLQRAIAALKARYRGTMLTDEQGQAAISGFTDEFGNQFRFDATFDHFYFLRSAGPDGQWDTADDPPPYTDTLASE